MDKTDRARGLARLMAREELLDGFGHGWEESHLIGDDEDPEGFDLVECVWINGHIMDADGSDAHADSDYWKENYGTEYGVRVWRGVVPPTEEQRKGTPFGNASRYADPAEGQYSGLIAEE